MSHMHVRIRQCRRLAGWSQAGLATATGVRRSAVAQWEKASHGTSPSIGHLVDIALATGVSFEWLATGRGPMRLDGLDLTPTALTQDFAMDELESRVLSSVRRLSRRNREIACRILEIMAT
jgi:transcriptional regulator with XRE-family HTH domain